MNRQTRRAWARTFGKVQKRLGRMEYKCLIPGCNQTAINSHSQQKEGQLRAIARDGNVYALERNLYRALKGSEERSSILYLSLVGLKKASTFPGFCSSHDTELFVPIEKIELNINDPEQAYCFFLRAMTYEYSQKRKMVAWMEMLMKEARANSLPLFDKEYVELFTKGMKYFVTNDAPFYFNEAFRTDVPPTEWLRWSWIAIPNTIGASCTCCFSPLQEQHESYMLDHFGEPQPLVMFSLLPQSTCTHVVLCWHSHHTHFVQDLEARMHDNDNLEAFINECAFAESEDTCINPDLWENTPERERLIALNAMRHQEFRGPINNKPRIIKL